MKYIFIDVDGTLVDYEKHLPDSAVLAIRKTRELGNKVFICTGRSKAEIFDSIWDIGIDGMIGGNGAYIEVDGKVIFHKTLSSKDSRDIVDYLKSKNIEFYLESNNGLFASKNFEEKADVVFKKHAIMKKRKDADTTTTRSVLHGIIFDGELYRDDLNKVSYILNSYKDYLDMCLKFPNLNNGNWGGEGSEALFGDIGVKGCNKGTGVRQVLKYCGAKKKDSISFGDAKVDIPMFENTGISVCMENGSEEAMLEAKMIADNVENDGLYKMFKELNLI